MQWDFLFLGSKITADGDCSHEIRKWLLVGRKAITNLDSALKSKDITLPTEVCIVKAMVFPVVIYGCKSQTIKIAVSKNWCFLTVVLEKALESPLERKEIKPVNPKENQPWILTGRTNVEAEAPILWPTNANSQLIGKDPDAGKDWKRKEKRVTEDEMVGWHHWFNGHELGQTLRNGEEQGVLACYCPWGSQRVEYNLATEQPPPPLDHLPLLFRSF